MSADFRSRHFLFTRKVFICFSDSSVTKAVQGVKELVHCLGCLLHWPATNIVKVSSYLNYATLTSWGPGRPWCSPPCRPAWRARSAACCWPRPGRRSCAAAAGSSSPCPRGCRSSPSGRAWGCPPLPWAWSPCPWPPHPASGSVSDPSLSLAHPDQDRVIPFFCFSVCSPWRVTAWVTGSCCLSPDSVSSQRREAWAAESPWRSAGPWSPSHSQTET